MAGPGKPQKERREDRCVQRFGRAPDPANGRYTNAILTDAGHSHLVSAAPGHVARVRELVIDVLGPGMLQQLRNCSERLLAPMDD